MKIFNHPILLFAAIGCLFSGCATRKFAGIEEYNELTGKASTAVRTAVRSLERVSANPAHPTPKTVAAFSSDVQRLQIDSIKVRARARAIRARGDAYFADWSASLANIKDPKVRAAVERSRPRLEASFSQIKLASQQAGAAFDPFLSGLQKLRVDLEIKPEASAVGPNPELVRATFDHGRQVLKQLGVINSELNSMKQMLTSNPSSPTP